MPSRTLEDKVEELTKLVAAHAQQLNNFGKALGDTAAEHARTVGNLHDLKNLVVRLEQQLVDLQRWKADLGFLAELKTDVTILRRDVDRLEKTKEEWGRRFWAMLGPVVGAVSGAVVGWTLGYFSRH